MLRDRFLPENGKLYQDRIYGPKVLSPLATALADAAEFQRLAHLKQLGYADVAYRSAVHTRMEHSFGTSFACRRLMRKVVQNHDRLLLDHPGSSVSPDFAVYPRTWQPLEAQAQYDERYPSYMARWRGVTELVGAAALLHDLGHAPYGHTLEDEFAGLYPRHDAIAGPRLFHMLFHEQSELAAVFDRPEPWIPRIQNRDLQRLIYLILNWKDEIIPPKGFSRVLDDSLEKLNPETKKEQRARLQELIRWHNDFSTRQLFRPFMSDIIGNTICADLLDYLPRDRQNLGMEPHLHDRLQRYLVIKQGTYYENEGLRLSIMVTRPGRGGQRRDVATAVMDVMRERYEMAERVYYHHKKAAASTMLAKLVELADGVDKRPRDDEAVYPAPWEDQARERPSPPHVVHLGDSELLDYLGREVTLSDEQQRQLQWNLYQGLRYRRTKMYRTLLVLDPGLVTQTPHELSYFAAMFRGSPSEPSKESRVRIEADLAKAAGIADGQVLIYCPSPRMQAKEVDVRIEIREGAVLPLRVQREQFTYSVDLRTLMQYYEDLWRAYVFVDPDVYRDSAACRRIIERLCQHCHIPLQVAFTKVRGHDFAVEPRIAARRALDVFKDAEQRLPFELSPAETRVLLDVASKDEFFLEAIVGGRDPHERLLALAEIVSLESHLQRVDVVLGDRDLIRACQDDLRSGQRRPTIVPLSGSRGPRTTLTAYGARLATLALRDFRAAASVHDDERQIAARTSAESAGKTPQFVLPIDQATLTNPGDAETLDDYIFISLLGQVTPKKRQPECFEAISRCLKEMEWGPGRQNQAFLAYLAKVASTTRGRLPALLPRLVQLARRFKEEEARGGHE